MKNVLLGALVLTAVACGDNARRAPATAPSCNVLLITIDTLRHDYLGASRSGRVRTPFIDELAEKGAYFTRARTPVPLTLPAHASILTGAYPPSHGVRLNAAHRLPESARTLAEILQEKDYATAAFVGSFVLDRRFGLAQGFDVYDDEIAVGARSMESLEAERDASRVLAAFEKWLADRPDRPFFAWVHFFDPHAPYAPPEPYRSQYPEDPYAGEVAYADAMVGRVLELLRERSMMTETMIALVGDHGEGLGEHGEATHSVLIYQSTLHVPLLLHAPGVIPGGQRVDALARTIDLAPTLLDYLGIAERPGEGLSLRPLIEGQGGATPEFAYSESLYASTHLGWAELSGLEEGSLRYIEAPRPELYDLARDPGEGHNLFGSLTSEAARLKGALEALRKEWEGEASEPVLATPDAETVDRLRSLGYLSGGRSRASASDVDPKDRMDLWNLLQIGIHQFGQKDYLTALGTFEKALADDANVPLTYEHLGACYMQLARQDEAERLFRLALSRGLEDADFHFSLGLIHYHRGDAPGAAKELEAAVSLDPMHLAAHYHLGNAYRALKRYQPALETYRKALAINPRYLYAFDGMGITLSHLGRHEEALRAFREVVLIDPEGAQGYFNLAAQLERMGKDGEARATYREFLGLARGDALEVQRKRAQAALERLGREIDGR